LGFAAQGIKQFIQTELKPKNNKTGMVIKVTPDYGYFENKDFIK